MPQIVAPAKSLLKETIESFSEQGAIKGKAVRNTLIKKGVKPAEIEGAGLPALDPNKSYNKAELMDWLSKRQDIHTTINSLNYSGIRETTEPVQNYNMRITEVPKIKPDIEEIRDKASQAYIRFANSTDENERSLALKEWEQFNTEARELEKSVEKQIRGSGHVANRENYLYHTRMYDKSSEPSEYLHLKDLQETARRFNDYIIYDGSFDDAVLNSNNPGEAALNKLLTHPDFKGSVIYKYITDAISKDTPAAKQLKEDLIDRINTFTKRRNKYSSTKVSDASLEFLDYTVSRALSRYNDSLPKPKYDTRVVVEVQSDAYHELRKKNASIVNEKDLPDFTDDNVEKLISMVKKGELADKNIDKLTKDYQDWVSKELPQYDNMSADDLFHDVSIKLTKDQEAWLEDFMAEWNLIADEYVPQLYDLVHPGAVEDEDLVDELYSMMADLSEAIRSKSPNKEKWIREIVADFKQRRQKVIDRNIPSTMLHEKDWDRKALEQEIIFAKKDGINKLRVPITDKRKVPDKAPNSIDELMAFGSKYGFVYDEDINRVIPNDTVRSSVRVKNELMQRLRDSDIVVEKTNSSVGPNSVKKLVRGTGVQKNYEKKIDPTIKKLAKESGGTYSTVEEDGVYYAQISWDDPAKINTDKFKLYSASGVPIAMGLGDEKADAAAIDNKVTQDKVEAAIAKGYTKEQIAAALNKQAGPGTEVYQKAIDAGYTPEQIQAALNKHNMQLRGIDKEEFPEPTIERRTIPGEIRANDPNFKFDPNNPSAGLEPSQAKVNLPKEYILEKAALLGVDPTTEQGINVVYASEEMESKKERFNRTLEIERDRLEAQAKDNGYDQDWVETNMINFERKYAEEYGKQFTGELATLQEIADVDRPFKYLASLFGSQGQAIEYEALQNNSVQAILDMAKARDLNLQYIEGEFFVDDGAGNLVMVEPGLLQSLGKAKYETIGAIGGATLGVKLAQYANSIPGLPGKMLAATIALGGGTLGAVIGDQIDYLEASILANQEWNAAYAAEKAIGTAQMDMLFAAGVGTTFKGSKFLWESIVHIGNMLKDGNTKGAFTALKHALGGLEDDEVAILIKKWEDLNQKVAPGKSLEEKALAVLPTTQAGGENIILAVAGKDVQASTSVFNEINKRAKTLLSAIDEMVDKQPGKFILDKLNKYVRDVKDQYTIMDEVGQTVVRPSYKFNFNKLSIQPLLEHKIATISDPAKVNQLLNQLNKINENTTSRTFGDLLDLYRTLNNFKYNKSLQKAGDKKAVQDSLNTVRAEIEKQANMTQKGRNWLIDFDAANKSYSEMLQFQKNTLYKSLIKPGMSEDDIARQFLKYADSIDDTYKDVLKRIGPKGTRLVENSIVDQVTRKYTLGRLGEFNAIDFVGLSKELEKFPFITPDAARINTVVDRMAEVYKNDPMLSSAAGRISVNQDRGSSLTWSLVEKAKIEAAGRMWSRIKSLVRPSNDADYVAMVNKVAKMLEQPLNAKTTKQVLEAVKDDQELVAAINKYNSEMAKAIDSGYVPPGQKVWKDASGKLWTTNIKGTKLVNDKLYYNHRAIDEDMLLKQYNLKKLTSSTLTTKIKLDLLNQNINAIKLADGQIRFIE